LGRILVNRRERYMPEFVIFLVPREGGSRPGIEIVRQHCERLQLLSQEGRCLFAGPFEDRPGGGMVVGQWEDLAEAETFAQEDPFVTCGYEDVTVRPVSWSRPENGQLGLLPVTPGVHSGFLESLRLRWSCRDFDATRELSRVEVEELIEVALLAPSEFNLQPNRPLVCHSLEDRRLLRACCWDQVQVEECGVAVVCTVDPELFFSEIPRSVEDFIQCGRYSEEVRASREEFVQGFYGEPQVRQEGAIRCGTIFAHQLLLAGFARGLAGCWIAGFEAQKLKEELGIPDRAVPVGVILLGYPRKISAPMPRRPLQEVTHWGRWTE
jgi:nitroreductase/uncharacterized protein YciI